MKLLLPYSPDATRWKTSRRVTSGSILGLAAAAALVDHHNEILHASNPALWQRNSISYNQKYIKRCLGRG